MDLFSPAEAPAAVVLRERSEIEDRYKWNLASIFADWAAWDAAYAQLDRQIDEFARLQGTLAGGAERLLAALELRDSIGQLSYKVWYFASLWYDQDQHEWIVVPTGRRGLSSRIKPSR
jgi:oligoendopeptidase F